FKRKFRRPRSLSRAVGPYVNTTRSKASSSLHSPSPTSRGRCSSRPGGPPSLIARRAPVGLPPHSWGGGAEGTGGLSHQSNRPEVARQAWLDEVRVWEREVTLDAPGGAPCVAGQEPLPGFVVTNRHHRVAAARP